MNVLVEERKKAIEFYLETILSEQGILYAILYFVYLHVGSFSHIIMSIPLTSFVRPLSTTLLDHNNYSTDHCPPTHHQL